MKMFPVLRKRRVKTSAVKTTEEVQVYCKLRIPELTGEQLIECTNCKEWYHLDTCIDVPPTTSSVPWFCRVCNLYTRLLFTQVASSGSEFFSKISSGWSKFFRGGPKFSAK